MAGTEAMREKMPRQNDPYESRREREFYRSLLRSSSSSSAEMLTATRYFEPIRSLTRDGPPLCDLDSGQDADGWRPTSSPDLALTAFCQLGALRVNTRRAMLFFFDQDFAYILAEATRSLSLLDGSIVDEDDEIWLGHSKIPRGYSVCEKTTVHCPNPDLRDPDPGTAFLHVISDLREDTTFCNRPYVVGGPKARFYAGVPITTPRGINIGAYCVLDDKPRGGLTHAETTFLRHMSASIMDHLEGARAKAQSNRSNQMIDGLSAFVDGVSDLGDGSRSAVPRKPMSSTPETRISHSSPRKTPRTSGSLGRPMNGSGNPAHVGAAGQPRRSHSTTSPTLQKGSLTDATCQTTATVEDQSQSSGERRGSSEVSASLRAELISPEVRHAFQRAAGILRSAVGVDGTMFFDAATASYGGLVPPKAPISESEPSSDAPHSSNDDSVGKNDAHRGWKSRKDSRKCEALAMSTSEDGDKATEAETTCISERLLMRLLREYPHGKVWNFDRDGNLSSDNAEDDSTAPGSDALARKKDRKRSQARDGRRIASLFPGVRSLAIVGLWDRVRSRPLAAGVVWSCDPFHILSEDLELPFLKAFGDVLVAEFYRLQAQKETQAKNDFISSISHELRSPLHGILGSAECIEEQGTDEFTAGLVSQMMTCGKTLLDIVDHLLDYSKINYYGQVSQPRRHTEQADRQRLLTTATKNSHLGSMMSLDSNVSLSAVTEEVVDTVYYSFCCGKDRESIRNRKVSVILDIDQDESTNWQCRIALGAWKRIIGNLVGNALKYTEAGYIHIALKKIGYDALFTVRDTGIGMSTAFLNHGLFNAFAQENSFAEGTGLGMSLVASIIKSIDGSIEVQSQQNVGTTVTVTVPLMEASGAVEDAETNRPVDLPRHLHVLMPFVSGPSMNGQKATQVATEADKLLIGSLVKTCQNHNVRTLTTDDGRPPAQTIQLAFEKQLRQEDTNPWIATQPTDDGSDPAKPLIIICDTHLSLRELARKHTKLQSNRHVELIPQPAGPDRLLKAMRACLSALIPQAGSSDGTRESPTTVGATLDGAASDKTRVLELSDVRAQRETSPVDEVVLAPFAAVTKSSNGVSSAPSWNSASPKTSESVQQSKALFLPQTLAPTGSHIVQKALSPSLQPTTASPATSPGAIDLLLVDDNLINLKLLTTFAKKHAHRHLLAHNGQHAVEAYKAACTGNPLPPHLFAYQGASTNTPPKRPRVILLDINMPIMDGYEATRQIRSYEQHEGLGPSTIIALTGLGSASAQQEAYACGIDLFMTKPVKLKELSKILEGIARD